MKLAHCADLHLGFRQFERANPEGANVRELDVTRTFNALIDALIVERPHVIVIGGDVVHQPRPTNRAILALLAGFTRLRDALSDTPIIIAAGNHDLSRTRESANILDALIPLGVQVAGWSAQRIRVPELDLSVLAVPDAPGVNRPDLTTDPAARYNVLVMHGEVQGMAPRAFGPEIAQAEIGVEQWSYIALGHWHQFRQITPNMAYSGSIDFTSSDPWSEIGTPKGFIMRDLERGTSTFHALPVSRPHIDLTPIDARGLSPSEIDSQVAERVNGLDAVVARLVIANIDKATQHALDQEPIRLAKRAALHLHIDYRRPERVRRDLATAPRSRGISLSELVTRKLAERPTDLPADRVAEVAMRYLAQAGEVLPVETSTEQLTEVAA